MSMRRYTVAIVNDSGAVDACAFHHPPCPMPGIFAEMTLLSLEFLLGEEVELDVVPATGYSWKSPTPSWNDTSTMGMVNSGRADFTDIMYVQHDRVQEVPLTSPQLSLNVELVYRKVDTSQPSLNAAAITSWQLYAFVFVMAAVFRGVKLLLMETRLWKAWVLRRASAYVSLVFGIFLACFLKYLSSDIVLILNRMGTSPVKYKTHLDVVDAMERGELTALAIYPVVIASVINPTDFAGKSQLLDRLIRIAEYNPPRLVTLTEAMELITGDGEAEYVLFTDSVDLYRVMAAHCGFSVVSAAGSPLPRAWYTVYHRRGLRPRLRSDPYSGQLQYLWQDRLRAYFPPKVCNAEGVVEPSSWEGGGPRQLSLAQIQIVFWLLLSGTGVAVAAAAVEALHRRTAKIKPTFRRPSLPPPTLQSYFKPQDYAGSFIPGFGNDKIDPFGDRWV